MSNDSIFDQKIKQMAFNKLSDADKSFQRRKILTEVFAQLTDKTNRYIFYCPDIVVVNNLVKLIYETAWEIQKLGYKVMVLHEINGFKCKWLFDEYKHLKEIEIDYVIKKKSSKSKRTKANYSFRPSDTLIVPDHFQEMLDNLVEVKMIQKVVLVSSYSGLISLSPGTDYHTLGVSRLLFAENKLKEDYSQLFDIKNCLIDNYPIDRNMFKEELRVLGEIYPVFCISNIGNNDLTQQVINVYYNKYPQLRVFSFKILPRDNYEYYINTLKHSAALVVLDKTLGNRQMVYEALAMGLTVLTFKRREVDESELGENIIIGNDAFEIADNLALFAQHWLNMPTGMFEESMKSLRQSTNLAKCTYENYRAQLHDAIKELQEERVKYFSKIKESIESLIKTEELAEV